MQEHKQNKGYKSIALPPTLLPLLHSRLSAPLHCFLHVKFTRSNTSGSDCGQSDLPMFQDQWNQPAGWNAWVERDVVRSVWCSYVSCLQFLITYCKQSKTVRGKSLGVSLRMVSRGWGADFIRFGMPYTEGGDGFASQTLTVPQHWLLHTDNGSDWHWGTKRTSLQY